MAYLRYPALDPVAFSLGPLDVRWYGLAYLAGFVVAYFVIRRLSERWGMGLTADDVIEVMLALVIAVLVGSRVGWLLFYGGEEYLPHPLRWFAVWEGGMSFHGGLAGVLLAGVYLTRRLGVPYLRLADACAVAAPFGFFLGRLANFVNGELWGRVTTRPWGMVFPGAGPLPRHPSQLYEAGLEGLVLFGIMLLLARRRRPDGEQLGWFLGLYGAFRILSELFRQPDVEIGFLFGPVTTGMLLSLPMIAAGAALVARARRADR